MSTDADINKGTAYFCSGCGSPIVPGSLFCSSCGTPVAVSDAAAVEAPAVTEEDSLNQTTPIPAPALTPEETPRKAEKPPKKSGGAASVVLTVLLCILTIPCVMFLIVLLLIHSLFPGAGLPSGLDAPLLFRLANELYPLIICSVLITLFLVMMILLNKGRFRRFLLSLGLSFLLLSLLTSLCGVFASAYVLPFPLDREMVRQYIVYFREWALVVSTVCTAAGLLFTVLYLCIAAAKKRYD